MSRITVTLPADLRQAVQQAAEGADVSFSSIVSDALNAWVRGGAAGELLGRADRSGVVDALVASPALPGDQVLTSDLEDLTDLIHASTRAGSRVRVVAV